MTASRPKNDYKEFVFLSAGPVGDHALIIDHANRFFESTGIPSRIIMKHPNAFLRDLALPYQDHISYLSFKGAKEKAKVFLFVLSSMWIRRCYLLVLPIPPPTYLKLFAYYIRFLTRSRIVALDSLCGFAIPGGPFSSASFVGKGNYIKAHVDKYLYHEQANNLLHFLGYKMVERLPSLQYIEAKDVLKKNNIEKPYISFHICASQEDRSLPRDRWDFIISSLARELPGVLFVFTGTKKDVTFIEESTKSIPPERKRVVTEVGMQELLTLYSHAKLAVTVHTGNAHLVNMLHANAVTVNFKGIYMFRFAYNPHGVEIFSEEGCTCHPLERRCSSVSYKGKEYMACLFNLKDEHIIKTVLNQYAKAL